MKFYLNLIIVLLLALSIQASNGNCALPNVTLDVTPVSICSNSNSNGGASATVNGNSSLYSYQWIDLSTNGYVATNNPTTISNVKAGDYKLVVKDLFNPGCKVEKEFFIHGKNHAALEEFDNGDCYVDDFEELRIDGVLIIVWDDKSWMKQHFGLTSNGNELDDIHWGCRINNPGQKAERWVVVPKPPIGIIYSDDHPDMEFVSSNTYEFVAVNSEEFINSPHLISRPVRAFIYHAPGPSPNSKLASNILNNSISVSPQPANDYITVELNPDFKMNSYEILNLNGQLLRNSTISYPTESAKVNVADFKSGFYILKVNSETETLTKKITIR